MKKLLYIDLFCGAGGTSTGVESATIDDQKCAEVIACVNHDPHAIASHLTNHPEAKHYTEDIRTLDLTTLVEHTERMRKENPDALLVLWASMECTNFSRAKGGLPRDADSRTLAEHLFRYIDALSPDYIQIENVREFMMWGDLDENGKPVSKDAGRLYLRWVNNVRKRGYAFDHRILNAADYGAYTSRERFFGIFARKGLPIVFPEPTHSRTAGQTLFQETKPWKPVKEVLDLDDFGRSIFREKPLSEKTLQRIYAGLIKFVAGGRNAYLLKQKEMKEKHRAGESRQTAFLSKQYSGDPYDKNIGVDGPAGAITTRDHHMLVTTRVDTQFFANSYSGGGQIGSIEKPAGTVTTVPKINLVTVKPWIMDTSYANVGSSVDEPSRTITANHKWHYLVNPQFASDGSSVEKPCFTLIARMDKKPPYMVTAEQGTEGPAQDSKDSPMTAKIKEFMGLYGISDICMRMLKIPELKRIMGFPDDYVLVGTQTEQKKYIGNAVETHMACALCKSIAMEINRTQS